jgi:hypothetical protein
VHTVAGWLRQVAAHSPVLLPGLAVLWAGSALLAAGWFAASRIAYVLYIGLSLRGRIPPGAHPAGGDAEAEWRRFRARLSWLLDNDTVAFGALCLVTLDTFDPPGPRWLAVAAGAALFAAGVSVKAWAAASLLTAATIAGTSSARICSALRRATPVIVSSRSRGPGERPRLGLDADIEQRDLLVEVLGEKQIRLYGLPGVATVDVDPPTLLGVLAEGGRGNKVARTAGQPHETIGRDRGDQRTCLLGEGQVA